MAFESDYLNLIKEIHMQDKQLSYFGLIADIAIESLAFQDCLYSHVPKAANKVGHYLAQLAIVSSTDFFSLGHVPVKTPELCLHDSSFLS